MEKVWLVFTNSGRFKGVFTTEELAKKYIADDLAGWGYRNDDAYLKATSVSINPIFKLPIL